MQESSKKYVTVQTPDTIRVIASESEAIPALPAGGSRDRHVRAPFDSAGLAMTTFYQKTELFQKLLPDLDL